MLLLLLVVAVAVHGSHPVTISNVQPRVDRATGKILELGDGSIAKFGSKYYLYGVKYVCTPSPQGPTQACEPKDGDRRIWGNMSFGIASSTDMVTWDLETYNAIPEMHDPNTRWPASKYVDAWHDPPPLVIPPYSKKHSLGIDRTCAPVR